MIFAAGSFTGADRNLLFAEVARFSPYYCRMCGSCEGSCRQGLPVADVRRYLMYAESYDSRPAPASGFARSRHACRRSAATPAVAAPCAARTACASRSGWRAHGRCWHRRRQEANSRTGRPAIAI